MVELAVASGRVCQDLSGQILRSTLGIVALVGICTMLLLLAILAVTGRR